MAWNGGSKWQVRTELIPVGKHAGRCLQPRIQRVTLYKSLEGQDLEIGVHQFTC